MASRLTFRGASRHVDCASGTSVFARSQASLSYPFWSAKRPGKALPPLQIVVPPFKSHSHFGAVATKSFEYYCRNPAIRVLDLVQETNVTRWGFAIYRCTYTDEGAWIRLVDALGAYIRKSFANSQALDMLENFKLDIREDRKAFENATPEYVREQFQSWIVSNGMAESPNPTHALRVRDGTPDGTCIPFSTRYQFCVHVDSASLDSIIRALDGDKKVNSYVTLISATHGLFEPPPVEEEVSDDDFPEDNDEGLEEYISEPDEEPLGYMRVKFSGLMPEKYGALRDWSDFDRVYRKPPSIWGGGAYYADDVYDREE